MRRPGPAYGTQQTEAKLVTTDFSLRRNSLIIWITSHEVLPQGVRILGRCSGPGESMGAARPVPTHHYCGLL